MAVGIQNQDLRCVFAIGPQHLRRRGYQPKRRLETSIKRGKPHFVYFSGTWLLQYYVDMTNPASRIKGRGNTVSVVQVDHPYMNPEFNWLHDDFNHTLVGACNEVYNLQPRTGDVARPLSMNITVRDHAHGAHGGAAGQGKSRLLPRAPPYYPFPRGKIRTRGNIWSFTVG